MARVTLPRWVASDEESLRRETARARAQTPAERWQEEIEQCGLLRLYWALPGYPERVRTAEDPLPESSRRALARLRKAYRKRRGSG